MTTDPLARAELQLPLAYSLDQTGRADLALEIANQALETFRKSDESVGVAKAATAAAEILSKHLRTNQSEGTHSPGLRSNATGQE